MIRKKGFNYWVEQKKKNTKRWQRFKKAWDDGVFRKDILDRFDISEGTLSRVVKACNLKKRDGRPYSREIKEKIGNPLKVEIKKKDKQTLLAEAIWKKIQEEKPNDSLPRIISPPIIKPITQQHKDESQVILFSDYHVGVKTKSFNALVCKQRMNRFIEGVLKINQLHRKLYPIRDCYLFFLGDGPNGEKVGKNVNADEFEFSTYYQIFDYFVPHTVELLSNLANNFENVYVTAVPGNHGSPAGRESAYSTNWDTIGMEVVCIRMSKVKNVHFDIAVEESYKIAEVKGHYFLLTHGDSIPIHLTIPFYGMTTRALRMRAIEGLKAEVVPEIIEGLVQGSINKNKASQMLMSAPFNYFCTGHFHTVNRFDFSGIEFLTNGTFKSDDQYVLKKMGMGNSPCQVTFGVSAKRGITWHYKVQLDK